MKNRIVDGATPLHFASGISSFCHKIFHSCIINNIIPVAAGKIKTVLWLIKNDSSGELLNSADDHGDTPLHDATESGYGYILSCHLNYCIQLSKLYTAVYSKIHRYY